MLILPCRVPCVGGNDAFTKTLLHFDGADGSTTITDYNAVSVHSWTAPAGSIAVAQYMFGGSSFNCGAASGYVTTSDSAQYTLGSGAFTIDCWVRPGSTGAQKYICGQADATPTATTRSADLQIDSNNKFVFNTWVSSAQTTVTGTTSISISTWYHVAAVRTGNTLKLFVNGIQEGGDVTQAGTLNDSANNFSVGRLGSYSSSRFNGYIDEFRFSVGVARWTANFPLNYTTYG